MSNADEKIATIGKIAELAVTLKPFIDMVITLIERLVGLFGVKMTGEQKQAAAVNALALKAGVTDPEIKQGLAVAVDQAVAAKNATGEFVHSTPSA